MSMTIRGVGACKRTHSNGLRYIMTLELCYIIYGLRHLNVSQLCENVNLHVLINVSGCGCNFTAFYR